MTTHANNETDAVDERFTKRATVLFDDSVQALDGQTRSQLNRARQNAMARRPQSRPRAYWVSAVATVAAVAITGSMLWSARDPATMYAPPAVTSDFEILLDAENLELLEDLEFYSWMDDALITGGHVG